MSASAELGAAVPSRAGRRLVLLCAIALGSLALVLTLEPIAQSQGYHSFADQRTILGIPNFLDLGSNLAFLLVGLAGLAFCFADRACGLRVAWLTFFAGVTLVSAGSAYYHASPNDATLVWDRLPITVAFMGLWAAVLGEYVSVRLGRLLLPLAVIAGLASVAYWHWSGDLRFYAWIQLMSVLTIPAVMVLFRPRYTHGGYLLAALALYGLAKVSETHDRGVFELTGQIFSGHTLKHLIAAASCLAVLLMLARRKPVGGG